MTFVAAMGVFADQEFGLNFKMAMESSRAKVKSTGAS